MSKKEWLVHAPTVRERINNQHGFYPLTYVRGLDRRGTNYYLRCRTFQRARRFLEPTLRRRLGLLMQISLFQSTKHIIRNISGIYYPDIRLTIVTMVYSKCKRKNILIA